MKLFTRIYRKICAADTRFFVLLSFLFLSVTFGFTYFKPSLERLFDALENLCTSWLCWLFFCYEWALEPILGSLPRVRATALEFPAVSFEEILNVDFAGLSARLSRFFAALGSMLGEYNAFLYQVLFWCGMLLSSAVIIPMALYFLIRNIMLSENGRENGYLSKPARAYIWLLREVLAPLRTVIGEFLKYAWEHKRLTYLIFALWLLNFNVLSIPIELLSLFYYFITSLSLHALAVSLAVIALDILIALIYMPTVYWLAVALRVYWRICEAKGLDRIEHMEAKNCGYIKTLDIVSLITGEPGTGKTTLLVSIILSLVNIYKKESLETLYKYELYFSGFPFSAYREELDRRIAEGELYSPSHVEAFVDTLTDFYEITGDREFIYGYDERAFTPAVDVGNRIISLRDMLKEYGKAYWVYVNDNLAIANFPIRFDGSFDGSSRLKLWNGSFLERKDSSRYAHILNQDMLRHGVKVDENSREIGALGPSVIGWTEISKDLGNQNTNAHLRADDARANAKNEKSIYSFMLARHAKTLIDNKVYIRFVTDDQRASNVMAAAVGLMSVINIKSKSERRIAIPGMELVFAASGKLCAAFEKFYLKRENARGDITLSMLLMRQTVAMLRLANDRLINRFGYEELTLIRQQGSAFSSNKGVVNASGERSEHVFYKLYVKDYSDRFASDVFSDVYKTGQLASKTGISDIPTYKGVMPTVEELEYQRSRLTSDIVSMIMGVDILRNAENTKASADGEESFMDDDLFL